MFIVGCVFLLVALAIGIAAHRLKVSSIELAKADAGHPSHSLKEEIPGVSSGFPAHALTIGASASAVTGLLFIIACASPQSAQGRWACL